MKKQLIKYVIGLLLAIALMIYFWLYQKTHACEVCQNRTMPVYNQVQSLIQQLLQIIPTQIPYNNVPSDFPIVTLRWKAITHEIQGQCLRDWSEKILGQDQRTVLSDRKQKIVDGYVQELGSLDVVDIIKDLTIQRQPEVMVDEYNRLSKLHDILNQRMLALAQTCAHNLPVWSDMYDKLTTAIDTYKPMLVVSSSQHPVLLNGPDSPLTYADVILFLKDLVWQSQIFLSKGEFAYTDFYRRDNDKDDSQKSRYGNINIKISNEFVNSIQAIYACARDSKLDTQKVCRRQEAQFHEIIKKIVGKTTWDVIEQYKEDVPADIDATKDQLNDESDSLKWSFKQSLKRIEDAIKLLRESNFGLKNTPAQDQLLETYYNRSIEDIRAHTIGVQAKKWRSMLEELPKNITQRWNQTVAQFNTAKNNLTQLRDILLGKTNQKAPQQNLATQQNINEPSAGKESKFVGIEINQTNIPKYANPTQKKIAENFYNTMGKTFNETMNDMDEQTNKILYYDSTPQAHRLPEISKTIYKSMITIGTRDQSDTLINGLNRVCMYACGPEGNCG
jgi:hypothetical protein